MCDSITHINKLCARLANSMKINIYILIFSILINFSKCYSTNQLSDLLIYNNDTLELLSDPLEILYPPDTTFQLIKKLYGYHHVCWNSQCWKGYIGEWKIINNKLCLTKLYNCCKGNLPNLKELFPNNYINNYVHADWVSESIYSPQGKQISQNPILYETELELNFKNGILLSTNICDNTKTRKTKYQNQDTVHNYIYSKIDWQLIPQMNSKDFIIWGEFYTNKDGKIDSIHIQDNIKQDTIFVLEYKKALSTIPDFGVTYLHGKPQTGFWEIFFIYNEEKRKKYAK